MDKKVGFTSSVSYACLEDLENAQEYHMSIPLGLNYCGEEECLRGHSWGPDTRVHYLIHVVEKGKGIFKKGDLIWELEEGDMFLIEPGEMAYYQADMDDPWKYIWIAFEGFRVRELLSQMGLSSMSPIGTLTDTTEIVACVREILKNVGVTTASEMYRTSILYKIFGLLMDMSHTKRSAATEYPNVVYVNRAMDYFLANCKEKIRVDEVAHSIGISRGHLARCFKEVLNMSPQECLLNFRMERAAGLLRETNEPIKVIASGVGYADPLAFSKVFKARFGMSPKNYRNAETVVETVSQKGYERRMPL